MKLNGVEVVERHNQPGVLSRNALRLNLYNNGTYFDPYEVSSVSLFFKKENVSPSSVLASGTQLITDAAASSVKFRWRSDNASGYEAESAFSTDASSASGVYRTDVGRFVVVLDGTQTVSSLDRSGNTIVNSASSVGDYIDVWTIKTAAAADWKVFINNFTLFQDNIIAVTEPLMMKSRTSLMPNNVRLDERVELKVPVEITVTNRNRDESIKNALSQGVLTEPQFRILKHNEDTNLPARVEVSGYSETSSLIETTSDNTMIFKLDTAVLTNGSISNLGAGTGTYSVEAKYKLLNETIISPMMYFTVR